MDSANKAACLLTNPKVKKSSAKISIDTKALPCPTKIPQAQSTKTSSNSIPTYRLMQYVFPIFP